MTPRAFLEDLFNTAVAAAHPATCLPPHLPAPPAKGRLILLAAGKAAGSMVEAAERHYLDEPSFPPRASPASRSRATAMGGRRASCRWSKPDIRFRTRRASSRPRAR